MKYVDGKKRATESVASLFFLSLYSFTLLPIMS